MVRASLRVAVLCALVANNVLAWDTWIAAPPHPLADRRVTYHVSVSFCDAALPRFYEDRFLSLRVIRCSDVRAFVRHAFDAWQHNARVVFEEVDGVDADVLVDGRVVDGNVLAHVHGVWTSEGPLALHLTVDADTCWYTDSAFCHALSRHERVIYPTLGSVWGLAMCAVGVVLLRPLAPFGGTARLVAWAVAIAPPLLYWDAIAPCVQCYDFTAVITHEVGHVLGMAHPDESTRNQCGCGADVHECPLRGEPIMYSVARHRGDACLHRDDVDAARTLYGGNCSQPVWCHDQPSYAGFARLAVALVYAFFIAWVAVTVRICACRRWRAWRAAPPAPPAPSVAPAPRAVASQIHVRDHGFRLARQK